jgi:RNA-directed DNA polymerase
VEREVSRGRNTGGIREGPNGRESEAALNLGRTRLQKSGEQLELPLKGGGEAHEVSGSGEALRARREDERSGTGHLMEEVVEKTNLKAALKRVKQNKGGPGIDGMTVGELPEYLKREWEQIREELLSGAYRPRPVKRQTIPKAGGGERELGIPTVLDRFIQQALLQVLQPRFDPGFSDHSYGFRPGRRAHDAVRRAQRYVQEGRRWVVDVDLSKFFDRVNHDILMGRLERRIEDKRVLGLIRRYLEAGVMVSGVVVERHEGTPQGGPLSPLLANVLLDEVDKELERRGHAFVRYADDSNVYVRSRRAGERVLAGLRTLYAALKLQVNEDKSAVDYATRRDFLGYSFWVAAGKVVKLRVAGKALGAMKCIRQDSI